MDEPTDEGWPYSKPAILPTWIVQARDTGKMHVLYALETPVHRNPKSLRGPLNKLANVADRLSYHLGGDPTYGGTITRTPSRAKGSNSQAALSIVKNGPPWVNCVTLTQLGTRTSAESNPGGGSQPRFS